MASRLLATAFPLAAAFSASAGVGAKPGFPPSLPPGCLKPDGQTNLYCPGDDGYGCYKIPTIMRTKKGTLLAMIEARKYSCDDQGWVDLRLRRSFDEGKTWTPSQLVYGNSTEGGNGTAPVWTTVGDGNWVQDSSTGTIWMLHTRNNSQLYLSRSDDEGASWSEPQNVTATLKFLSVYHSGQRQGWIGTGHAGGIELSGGPHKGRLIIPAYTSTSYTVYSDDGGASWHIGGVVLSNKTNGGECQMAETGEYAADGTPVLLFSMRPPGKYAPSHRIQSLSRDGGLSWAEPFEARDLPEPIRGCEGSLVYHPGAKRMYFSHPDPYLDLTRMRLRVWTSTDLGSSWHEHATVWANAAGYSARAVWGAPATARAPAPLGVYYDRNDRPMAIFEAQSVSWTTFAA